MKDYSAMSDFEINAAVSICLGIEYAAPPEMTGDGWKYSEGYFDPKNLDNPHRLQDFCNNPADAWPIIVGNEIALLSSWNEEGVWGATVSPWNSHEHKNPLRAAMIVYLQMMEAKA